MPMQIPDLLRSYEEVTRAIQVLNGDDARILGFTVSQQGIAASINAQDMDYPPQMLETIKSLVEARRQKIVEELGALGVTGLGAQPR